MARTIKIDYLARVEGEGALTIRFSGKKAKSVELRIFEPPRLFEAFLRGRDRYEAPDITARICGICPVAYQMSACHAVEDAAGVVLPDSLRRLRRLLYCGEWIESHVLHMFMLHVPDFLGYPDAISMAKDHGDLVKNGLRIKKAGNAIVSTLGGREIHPINVRVGGFYKLPSRSLMRELLLELRWARDAAEEALRWLATLDYPKLDRDYEFVALRHPTDYPFCEGRLVSNKGLDIEVRDYLQYFTEKHVPHSTALHAALNERGHYLCGPLARFNLNFDRLRERARAAAEGVGLTPPCRNPFKSLMVRGVEVIQALDEAVEIVEGYRAEGPAGVDVPHAAPGEGHGCTEAPRGILYHRYELGANGDIVDARIVPPTSQNLATIEADLFELAPELAEMAHDAATWRAEQAVRNYDPCISCSTHFLKLKLEQDAEPEPSGA